MAYDGRFTRLEINTDVKIKDDPSGIWALEFSPTGELAIGSGNGAITLYDTQTGATTELKKPKYAGYQIMCLRFHPKKKNVLLATTSDGKIYECNTKNGTIDLKIEEIDNEINCCDFSPDGQEFATAGRDLNIRIYDSITYKCIHTYEGYGETSDPNVQASTMRIFVLKYYPEKTSDSFNRFITGGWENQLKIWNRDRDEAVEGTISGPHICGDSIDIKDGNILAGSFLVKDALKEYDWKTRQLKKDIPFKYGDEHENAHLFCAKYCDNDIVLAGGSGTNSLRAINKETGEMIGEIKMKNAVQALAIYNGGRMIAVGDKDGKLVIARLL